MTKQALSIVSHTLETTAATLGPSATVVALFQRPTYFDARADAFRRLEDAGVSTIVAYAEAQPGCVSLASDDPLTRIWAAVLVSDTLCGFVRAVDLNEFGDTTDGLEPARLFDAEIGFDPHRTREVAAELIDQLVVAGLDPARAVLPAPAAPTAVEGAVEEAWASSMAVLADRLANVSEAWRRERSSATRDALTGLSNREGLHRWTGASADVPLPNGPVGLLFFDLNEFKRVNDRLGHDAGDMMLERVAEVIKRHVRRGDLAVRWGGDEFLLICPGLDDPTALTDIGERISDEIAMVEVGGMRASASFGGDVCLQRPITLSGADAELYRAKRADRSEPTAVGAGGAQRPA